MKDNFSTQADKYARFRPAYPAALYAYLKELVPDRHNAWDCATGNGQVARALALEFDNVYATDISQQQLSHAAQADNIFYSLQRAEETTFHNNTFDLVTVAQAIHWFDFGAFYKEVERTSRNNGVLAVIGYGLLRTTPATDAVIGTFYHDIIGPYWDPERKYVDEEYQTIPFPFRELEAPSFEHRLEWNLEQLTGYLQSWSATQHYKKQRQQDPLALIANDLERSFGNTGTAPVSFPVFLRVGKIEK